MYLNGWQRTTLPKMLAELQVSSESHTALWALIGVSELPGSSQWVTQAAYRGGSCREPFLVLRGWRVAGCCDQQPGSRLASDL